MSVEKKLKALEELEAKKKALLDEIKAAEAKERERQKKVVNKYLTQAFSKKRDKTLALIDDLVKSPKDRELLGLKALDA